MRALLAVGAALMVSTAAQATVNLVANGSFENGVAVSGPTYVATGDSTSITGWTVTAHGVNYTDDAPALGWDASEGSRSVELSSIEGGNGGLFQTISGFTAGRSYRLAFDVSANPYDTAFRPKDARIRFSVTGGGPASYDYALQNVNTATNMLYNKVIYDFVASSSMQSVSFRGAVNPFLGYGVVVDNVSIVAVPEASTWVMLILGFALVGVASRRRSTAVSA